MIFQPLLYANVRAESPSYAPINKKICLEVLLLVFLLLFICDDTYHAPSIRKFRAQKVFVVPVPVKILFNYKFGKYLEPQSLPGQ